MNIKWNPGLRRFEVEFHNFGDEQPRVKKAGFKTDGPPTWVWYSIKSEPLTKLREDKPAVLTISAEARAEYNALHQIAVRNAEIKAEMAKHTKALKKKLNNDKQDKLKPDEYFDEAMGFICSKVEPNPTAPVHKFTPPAPPEVICFICNTPVYSYEYGEGQHPACMWCQKIVLDNSTEVC